MRIIVTLGHPGHFHLFKNMVKILRHRGHIIKIVATDRGILPRLLDSINSEYEILDKHRKRMSIKGFGLVLREYRLIKIMKEFKPDLCVGMGPIPLAHISKLFNIPIISFTDTEHDKFERFLSDPFVTTIYTPSCFKKDLGPKQIRYNGYHELAYLHPNYFTPDPSVLDEVGLKKGERFIIMRFVAWNASHDIGHNGISKEMRQRFVSELGKYGRVLITSESELPAEFEPYQIKVAPEKMHDLLYYATLLVGESATMASECAVLGTPAIFIDFAGRGYTDEEEYKYGLIFNFSSDEESYDEIIKKILELVTQDDLKVKWEKKKDHLLNEKIDVTKFMIETIERCGGVVSE